MQRPRKQNFLNTTFAVFKFILFWVTVLLHIPILCLIPTGRASVAYMRFFMRTMAFWTGVRVRVHGALSGKRPLLCVCNHISVFEFVSMPIAFGATFFGKIDIAGYPVVGWLAKKFGVIFVDRRPSHAMDALNVVRNQMQHSPYPMFLFPEGTTTNGAYVKEFKSTLFNIVEGNDNLTIQPVVMNYRYRDGGIISDIDMANHFGYFDNAKQDMGPKCEHERSAFGQVFHIMVLGGFLVDIHVLPVPRLGNMDRKEIALKLHKIVSDKYMELKDKQEK
ncbi:MAG: 1-acyl-sn-glycerol-3-phosphate acyltransferase [Proteobacteria bacterium]|nr:1-acyl-sn-glycerol-3-phosphate acyltransferase [Candidatus Enterousia scatequi]